MSRNLPVPNSASDKEIESMVENFDRMNQVVAELIKGNSPTQVARNLGLKYAQVHTILNNWRDLIQNDNGIRERAREALTGADQHYSMLIKEAWSVVEDAGQQGMVREKTAAIKLVADIEQKRMDMLQKAGVLENNELADQLLETERKQKILVDILREVTSDCPRCKQEVAKRLREVTGKVEVIQVNND